MLARGTPRWVLAPFLIEVVAAGGYAAFPAPATLAAFLALSLVLTLLGFAFLLFFRDPDRPVGDQVVSPADGRVLQVDRVMGRLSIFMNLHNVHVNRAPLGGVVVAMKYRTGGHVSADRDEAVQNERLETRLSTSLGPLHLTQVSGAVARRIVPYIQSGQRVRKGQRIGLIRFGSRVEVGLPPGLRIVVARGDRVLAGQTTIAVVGR